MRLSKAPDIWLMGVCSILLFAVSGVIDEKSFIAVPTATGVVGFLGGALQTNNASFSSVESSLLSANMCTVFWLPIIMVSAVLFLALDHSTASRSLSFAKGMPCSAGVASGYIVRALCYCSLYSIYYLLSFLWALLRFKGAMTGEGVLLFFNELFFNNILVLSAMLQASTLQMLVGNAAISIAAMMLSYFEAIAYYTCYLTGGSPLDGWVLLTVVPYAMCTSACNFSFIRPEQFLLYGAVLVVGLAAVSLAAEKARRSFS